MSAHLQRRLYGTQAQTSRRLLFASALASAVEDSRPRLTSSEVFASSTAISTLQRSLVATTRVLAAPRAHSRTAACSRGSFDGSDRHHFFQGVAVQQSRQRSNQA